MPVTLERGKYRGRFTIKGVRYNVGSHDTERKAKLAITRKKKELQAIEDYRGGKSVEFLDALDDDKFAKQLNKIKLDDPLFTPKEKFEMEEPSRFDKLKLWLRRQLDN